MSNETDTAVRSRCGLDCTACDWRVPCNCGGCIETAGHPFHGECPIAVCCQERGYLHCGQCPDIPCAQLKSYSCDDKEHGDTPPGARIEQCRRWAESAYAVSLHEKIIALRMERQYLTQRCSTAEYDALYRDLQPGQNYYWHGFGFPPELTHRTDFDDKAYNKTRQERRTLLKLRLDRGGLGWGLSDDLPLFYALYRKPLTKPNRMQSELLDLIVREGPLTIQQMKEETGYPVKQITPALHRLQQAFAVYEDQYDGEWDRGWYVFDEMFPGIADRPLTRHDALKLILPRFARRLGAFTSAMAKSYYALPEKEIRAAMDALVSEGMFCEIGEDGVMLTEDYQYVRTHDLPAVHTVYALHRSDFLVKTFADALKAHFGPRLDALPYDHDPLQYILIDGEFAAVSVGHYRYGPYEIHDIVCDDAARARKNDVIAAVTKENGAAPMRFDGQALTAKA